MNVYTLLSLKILPEARQILLTHEHMEAVQQHAAKVFGANLQKLGGVPLGLAKEGASRVILQSGEAVAIPDSEH
jgi:hypothetical protein